MQGGLDLAQRDGQQRRGLRALGQALDNAKRRSGKLGQRRHAARGHPQRKAVGVGQGTARGILQTLGQFQLELGALGQGRGKLHAADQALGGCALILAARLGFDRLQGRLQANRRRQLARHGCVERQRHRPDGQAGRLGVFTLAGKFSQKRCTHLEGKEFFHVTGHPAGRDDTFAPHQLHPRRRREPPVARQRDDGQRSRARW